MSGTPFSPTFTGETLNVGGDTDTWGDKIKTNLDQIQADIAAIGSGVAANSLKGNNTGSTGGVRDLTGAEATALLSAVVGDSGSGGTKGLVPAPAAGDKRKVLTGAGSLQYGPGRKAGCVITTTSVNGSTPTLSGAWNVASLSNIVNSGGALAACTVTFTDALPDTAYAVHVQSNGTPGGNASATSYDTKATGSVVIYWQADGGGGQPTELSVSIF